MEDSYGLEDYSDQQPVLSIDPVCGMEVDEGAAKYKTTYWGQTYFFCSEECEHRFNENPSHYAGQQR